jgi:hypothetical protein
VPDIDEEDDSIEVYLAVVPRRTLRGYSWRVGTDQPSE